MIRNITVYLDNEQQKFMDSIRCGFIVAEREDGQETFHNDLIDNSEYTCLKELINDIAGIFKVHKNMVWVSA